MTLQVNWSDIHSAIKFLVNSTTQKGDQGPYFRMQNSIGKAFFFWLLKRVASNVHHQQWNQMEQRNQYFILPGNFMKTWNILEYKWTKKGEATGMRLLVSHLVGITYLVLILRNWKPTKCLRCRFPGGIVLTQISQNEDSSVKCIFPSELYLTPCLLLRKYLVNNFVSFHRELALGRRK